MLASVDWHIIWERIFHPDHVFFRALYTTVYIAVIAQVIGVVLGLIAALMRQSKLLPLRLLSGLYVLIFRGTPLLVQIFFVYFGANLLLGVHADPEHADLGLVTPRRSRGRRHPRARDQRGRVHAGDHPRRHRRRSTEGQMEAARSLGMTYRLAMRRIVLPQAARVIVPPLGNEFNNMLKTTSLVFTIGVYEMFADAEIHYSQTFKPVEYFIAVAFWYLVLTGIWTLIQAQIERKLAASDRGDELSLPRAVGGGMDSGTGLGARGSLIPAAAEQAADVVVRAVDVHKRFGRLEVLKGVDLEVRRRRDGLHHRPLRARASRPSCAASTTWRRSTGAGSR